jgi:hypothetical protein
MRFSSTLAIFALRALEQSMTELRHHARTLGEARIQNDLAGSIQATEAARRTLGIITEQVCELRRSILAFDQLGSAESVGEVVVRASRIILTKQVDRLQNSARRLRPSSNNSIPVWQWTRQAENLTPHLNLRLLRVESAWLPYRNSGHSQPSAMSYRMLYRIGVRSSQYLLKEIGADPELARFLEEGMAISGWPDVARACARILAVTRIDVGAHPDIPFDELGLTMLRPVSQRWDHVLMSET